MGPPPSYPGRDPRGGARATRRYHGRVDHPGRRAAALERFEELDIEALLVTQLVNVRYLTGFTGSNGQLLLLPGGGIFLTDSRYEEQSSHEVADLARTTYSKELPRAFLEACRESGVRKVGFESDHLSHSLWKRLGAFDVELVPVGPQLERLRWAKEAREIQAIESAQGLTDDAFERVVAKLSEGVTERDVAFELEIAMRGAGAERLAFDSIVAFGENAAEPHHRPTERSLGRGDVVKLDFGCVVDGYHSDMTRTVAFGEPPGQLREVYELVRAAQLAGIEAVRAGIAASDADEAARAVIRDAGYAERFGHSLGHGVGLEIHEGPSLRSGSTDVLPEDAVVTVEPGVYVPEVGGVRIEDMVVVEAAGCRPMPRTAKELLVL